MAFVQKSGKGFSVRQGNNGRRLSRHRSRSSAKKRVDFLHRKNKPRQINRGASARKNHG